MPAIRTARSGRASRAPERGRGLGRGVRSSARFARLLTSRPCHAPAASGGWRFARCRGCDLTAGLRGRAGSCSLPVISRPRLALCRQPRVRPTCGTQRRLTERVGRLPVCQPSWKLKLERCSLSGRATLVLSKEKCDTEVVRVPTGRTRGGRALVLSPCTSYRKGVLYRKR